MKRILICEDELDAQQSLQSMLTKRNFEVTSVDNGKDAIDKARQLKPDLVLLDIRMPKIDGLEVAREIRAFDKLAKIIFVTAFASPELRKEAEHFNIADYLVKPVSAEEIVKKIESSLT